MLECSLSWIHPLPKSVVQLNSAPVIETPPCSPLSPNLSGRRLVKKRDAFVTSYTSVWSMYTILSPAELWRQKTLASSFSGRSNVSTCFERPSPASRCCAPLWKTPHLQHRFELSKTRPEKSGSALVHQVHRGRVVVRLRFSREVPVVERVRREDKYLRNLWLLR